MCCKGCKRLARYTKEGSHVPDGPPGPIQKRRIPATAKSWSAGATSCCAVPIRRPSGRRQHPALWTTGRTRTTTAPRRAAASGSSSPASCPTAGPFSHQRVEVLCAPHRVQAHRTVSRAGCRTGTGWPDKIRARPAAAAVKVLNLFGYTGGATLACAQPPGAAVTHVDAAEGMVPMGEREPRAVPVAGNQLPLDRRGRASLRAAGAFAGAITMTVS